MYGDHPSHVHSLQSRKERIFCLAAELVEQRLCSNCGFCGPPYFGKVLPFDKPVQRMKWKFTMLGLHGLNGPSTWEEAMQDPRLDTFPACA